MKRLRSQPPHLIEPLYQRVLPNESLNQEGEEKKQRMWTCTSWRGAGRRRRRGSFSKLKGPEQSRASGTQEGMQEWCATGNRTGILVIASHMLNVIHGVSFTLFSASGGGSTEISLLRSSSVAVGMQWRTQDLNPGHV